MALSRQLSPPDQDCSCHADGRDEAVPAEELRCPQCGETKPLDGFHRDSNRRTGRYPWCKVCMSAKARARYIKNRDQILATTSAYHRAHPEEHRKRVARWREENREHHLAQARRHVATRTARKLAQFVEEVDPAVVLERDNGICGICGEPVDLTDFHIDHIRPLSRGGEHSYANTQTSHPTCNLRKNAKWQPI